MEVIMDNMLHINIFDIIVFSGVMQGLFLALILMWKSNRTKQANFLQGLMLLSLSLVIFEILLNNTGYILKVLPLTDFSEPLNFVLAPLFFLYTGIRLGRKTGKRAFLHFIPFITWTLYMTLSYIQPAEYKYNSYIFSMAPKLPMQEVVSKINPDPLSIRQYINQLTILQMGIYLLATLRILQKAAKKKGQNLYSTRMQPLVSLKNTLLHFFIILLVYLATKLIYGMSSDLGNYLISCYISFLIFLISWQIMIQSAYLNQEQSVFDFPIKKYRKSALSDAMKADILKRIETEMNTNRYFTNNLASLQGLAHKTGVVPHHLSQVINEKTGSNFFGLLARYRVEEAKSILRKNTAITIEELSEMVGYNSKSAFNAAFKKHCGQTPSEYRKGIKNTIN